MLRAQRCCVLAVFMAVVLASQLLSGKFCCSRLVKSADTRRGREVLPMPQMNASEISCLLKLAVTEAAANITSVGTNGTLKAMQSEGLLPTRWSKCAVVSSSGVVALKNHSTEIDAADAVMHFNTAPLEGYEGWVGSRDDMRFVNNQFAKLVESHSTPLELNNHTVYINVLPFADDDEAQAFDDLAKQHPGMRLFTASATVEHRVSLVLRHIYSDEWFREQGRSYMLTTGGVGMALALSLCDTVLAYGMAESEGAKTAPYHYYNNEGTTASKQEFHRSFTAEKDLWRRLSVSQVADIDANNVAEIPGFSHYDCTGYTQSAALQELEEDMESSKAAPLFSSSLYSARARMASLLMQV
mmetsp:Transcript_10779/g.19566  ORF Transcript_10779/g.19566 Transcript_10779/m.19566 type:complete len:356 (-) Transcript_10779:86-1153(-)